MADERNPKHDEALDALIANPREWFRTLRDFIARPLMRRERPSHTLQPTALVSELVLRLLRAEDSPFAGDVGKWLDELGDAEPSREELRKFLARAGKAARRILVDHARGKRRDKRGGGRRRVAYDADVHDPLAPPGSDAFLDVHSALDRLERVAPDLAEVFHLKKIHGYTSLEIAELLGVDRKTVDRRFDRARIWLRMELEEGETGEMAAG